MAKRQNFLSRDGADQLTRDVTRLFIPQIKGKVNFVKLGSDGRVIRVSQTATILRKEDKSGKYVVRQKKKHSTSYLNTVKSLAGFDD